MKQFLIIFENSLGTYSKEHEALRVGYAIAEAIETAKEVNLKLTLSDLVSANEII